MVPKGIRICPICGGKLRHYDYVKRVVRTKNRKTRKIQMRRFKCKNCHSLHRELPESVIPYKQYCSDIIKGVLDGYITSDTLGYEDYPCEMTMIRWLNEA